MLRGSPWCGASAQVCAKACATAAAHHTLCTCPFARRLAGQAHTHTRVMCLEHLGNVRLPRSPHAAQELPWQPRMALGLAAQLARTCPHTPSLPGSTVRMEVGWLGQDGAGPLKLLPSTLRAFTPKLWLNVMEAGSGPLSRLPFRSAGDVLGAGGATRLSLAAWMQSRWGPGGEECQHKGFAGVCTGKNKRWGSGAVAAAAAKKGKELQAGKIYSTALTHDRQAFQPRPFLWKWTGVTKSAPGE